MQAEISALEVSKLAQDRGCILKVLLSDGDPLYWVENQLFIGKPFDRLDELVQFICLLPPVMVGEG
jgi:hypothetical protein